MLMLMLMLMLMFRMEVPSPNLIASGSGVKMVSDCSADPRRVAWLFQLYFTLDCLHFKVGVQGRWSPRCEGGGQWIMAGHFVLLF